MVVLQSRTRGWAQGLSGFIHRAQCVHSMLYLFLDGNRLIGKQYRSVDTHGHAQGFRDSPRTKREQRRV
jgi:hypothetical protein